MDKIYKKDGTEISGKETEQGSGKYVFENLKTWVNIISFMIQQMVKKDGKVMLFLKFITINQRIRMEHLEREKLQ